MCSRSASTRPAAAQGPEFRVHTGTAGDQQLPALAMNAAGTFAVAWQGEDANGDGVFVRVFDAAGTR